VKKLKGSRDFRMTLSLEHLANFLALVIGNLWPENPWGIS